MSALLNSYFGDINIARTVRTPLIVIAAEVDPQPSLSDLVPDLQWLLSARECFPPAL
jgi:hypothetical protein